MKNIVVALLMILLAQSQNYIESDGKRIYVDSMTDQEIREYEKSKKRIKPAPVIERQIQQPQPQIETTPPAREPIIIRFEQANPQDYGETIKVRIKNRIPVDKEYYETTGRGTFKKVEIDKGKRVEESWKMEGGNLVKERNK